MTDAGNDQTYAIFNSAANRKIIADLEKSGANILLFPPVETVQIELSEFETAHLLNLKKFDWLIFADVFAVEYFLEILEANAVDFFDLDELRVCAFGETVSDCLRFASVHADVIPAKIETAQVFSALLNYVGAAEIGGLRFLFLTGDSINGNLPELLRKGNAEVVELPVYQFVSNETSELVKLKTLLKGGAIDEFVLTAPTDLTALQYYFQTKKLADVLAEIKIKTTDGVMFQAAAEYNLSRAGLFHFNKIDKVA